MHRRRRRCASSSGAPAGGSTDTLARALASEMGRQLVRTVIVENRPGAGGNIAADAVAKAAPDGNTLLMSFTSHAINASLYPSLPFDPVRDFTPLTCVATSPSMLVAHPSVPAKDVRELIALAKAKPGQLNFAIGSVGSSLHLAGDAFKMQSGVFIVNIPYRGTAPAIQDVLAGQVELMFAAVGNAQAQVKAGKLKALGVTSATRLAAFPDVPAISEVLPGYESSAWFGLFAPGRMDAGAGEKDQRRGAQGRGLARGAAPSGDRGLHPGRQQPRGVQPLRAERDHALGEGRQVLGRPARVRQTAMTVQSLAQKLIARAAGQASVRVGEIVTCRVDLAMFHDSSGPRRLKPMLEELGAPIWDKSKVVLVMDHYVPERDDAARRIVRIARDWAREQQLPHVYDSQGICHVVVPQHGHIRPGMFCVGGDSHSPTGGAFGAYMFGIGSTEMLGVVVTGEIWLRVPQTIAMHWSGRLAAGVCAKDMMLAMIARFGMNGADYQAVEFTGDAVRALSMQERMTLCNMSAELGAQTGLVAPDDVTRQWLRETGAAACPGDGDAWTGRPTPAASTCNTTSTRPRSARSSPRRTARRTACRWPRTPTRASTWPTSAPAPAPSSTTCALRRRCSRGAGSPPACSSWWRRPA